MPTIKILTEYGGNCTLLLYYILCVIYLFVREKNKAIKVALSVLSIIVLVLFAMPFVYEILAVKLSETDGYYRMLWLLPTSIVSAYATIKIAMELPHKYASYGLIIIMLICFAIGGNIVYHSPFFVKAENVYQVPDAVVDICDYITEDNPVVVATFPMELCPYVRQYTVNVLQTYGYDELRRGLSDSEDFVKEMTKGNPNLEILTFGTRYHGSQFVILHSSVKPVGNMEDYDYYLLTTIDGYNVYIDGQSPLYKEKYESTFKEE